MSEEKKNADKWAADLFRMGDATQLGPEYRDLANAMGWLVADEPDRAAWLIAVLVQQQNNAE